MKTKFSLPFRLILLAIIFMPIAVIQAQEDYQKQIDSIFNWTETDVIKTEAISLSQFNKMNNRELGIFFKQNDKDVFLKYRTGKTFYNIGLPIIIPGILITGIGVGMITHNDHYRYRSFGSLGSSKVITWEYLGGIFITAVGGVATIASTTFTIIGINLKSQSKKDFINKHFNNQSSYQPTLNIGYTGNGISLTINF